MMTIIEQRFLERVPEYLKRIAEALEKIADSKKDV